MKPDAPPEVRGKFRPIATDVTGIRICEHFPLMARMMNKVALIRSLHYNTGASHENGQRWMMTGHDFNPNDIQPHTGAVISRVFGARKEAICRPMSSCRDRSATPVPDHCMARWRATSARRLHEPFFLNADPAASRASRSAISKFRPDRRRLAWLDARRRELLSADFDDRCKRSASRGQRLADARQRLRAGLPAAHLPRGQGRFRPVAREPEKVASASASGRNTFGQSLLLARRLIESGVRYATVNHFDTVFGLSCWDMHRRWRRRLNNTYLGLRKPPPVPAV